MCEKAKVGNGGKRETKILSPFFAAKAAIFRQTTEGVKTILTICNRIHSCWKWI